MRKLFGAVLLAILVIAALPLMAQDDQTVGELALGTPELSLLASAVGNTDLLPALNGAGPITVFAPSNEAFEATLSALGITFGDLARDEELLAQILNLPFLPAGLREVFEKFYSKA